MRVSDPVQLSDKIENLKKKCWQKFGGLSAGAVGVTLLVLVLVWNQDNRIQAVLFCMVSAFGLSAWNAIDTYYRDRKKLLESEGLA
ncbi:hypothetical protein CYJ40_03595 [Brevibacterium ravenspurgense]|uniref:Uncharacterized protein n=1 Tax=Brevibacterium ravenspurgense TaxID=479117 RepID=A0A2I1IHR5_9MICO|nr:hypothetical protein CYJ40_03595 [Brevibacterium ravenspurgense]